MFIFNVKAKTLCSIIKDLCMHLKCLTMSKEIYTFRGQVNKKREREREEKREKRTFSSSCKVWNKYAFKLSHSSVKISPILDSRSIFNDEIHSTALFAVST
jgi:hypothetical protein